MKQIVLKPELHKFSHAKEFSEGFEIGTGDLILTNRFIYEPFFGELDLKADVIYQEEYGNGEPSDEMYDAICRDAEKTGQHKRIIGIGGGTVLDIAKLLALKYHYPAEELYDRKLPIEKDKELILVPTTCGTGSEVTNISILAFLKRNTKIGLALDEMYADKAVLVPELLKGLPFRFFATSSIDALIHAIESSLSPKATEYTKLFGYQAIEKIIHGYQIIAEQGEDARFALLDSFLTASNYAGIAFGTAGCGPVHAMSYPLGGTFHVAHGEANYAVFTGVMEKYMEIRQDGRIGDLNRFLSGLLHCDADCVYENLEKLLNQIISKKTLKEYGADMETLYEWAAAVIREQQRLMVNSFVPLDQDQVFEIYQRLYQ